MNLIEEYPTRVEALGIGHFGKVLKVKVLIGPHKEEYLALKRIDLDKFNDTKLEDIRKKMVLSNSINHKNLLSYKTTFIARKELWVLSTYMDTGSMEIILKSHFQTGIKDYPLLASILKQTLEGLEYLHKKDIKAANILLSQNGQIQISDFGLTTKLKKNKKHFSIVGSPCWMSPEVLEDSLGYDSKADIWSFGITALELAKGRPPHSDVNTMKEAILTIIDEPPPTIEKKDGWDEQFVEVINNCLNKDPQLRKSASQLLEMKFFKKAKQNEYIRDKLIKTLKPFEEMLDNNISQIEDEIAQIQRITQRSNSSIQWNLNLSNEGSNNQNKMNHQEEYKAGEIENKEENKKEVLSESQIFQKKTRLSKNIYAVKIENITGDGDQDDFFKELPDEEN